MNRKYANYGKLKQIAAVAVVGLALAALFYKLDDGAGAGCNLLSGAAWFVLQILRPVLLAGLQSIQPYLIDNSRVLHHLPGVVASIRPLLCAIAS